MKEEIARNNGKTQEEVFKILAKLEKIRSNNKLHFQQGDKSIRLPLLNS